MSNLIPEKRVNKNGVVVTKHVRANQTPAVSTSFPSPSPGINTARPATPILEAALPLFQRGAIGEFTLDDVAPEALEKIEALLKADSEMKPASYSVGNSISTALGQDSLEKCVEYLHNVAVFAPLVTALRDNSLSVSAFVTGLKYYPNDVLWGNMDYLKEAPDSLTEKAKSLMEFTLKANKRDVVSDALIYDAFMEQWDSENGVSDVYIKLRHDDLAAYIMEHPEHGDAILDMVEEAGEMLPLELLKGRLNHDVQPLREGFL
jgi:hypothetical protein